MANVIVYSTPMCPWCKKLKSYLDEKNVEYEDIDVSSNQEAAHEMMHKSGQMGVPVIFIDEEMMIGFDKDKLTSALEL